MTDIKSVDDLAQIIRRVDGENKLGAGALAEAILAALNSPPDHGGGEGWQGMDTAPTNGTLFLAYSSRNGSYDLLRWVQRYEGYQPTFVSALGYGGIPIAFVTHWHPLPSLPTQKSEDGR